MFPDQISKVARVSIEHEEWNTLGYLVHDLYGWMDCPDEETRKASDFISALLVGKLVDKANPKAMEEALFYKLLGYAKELRNYSARCLRYYERNASETTRSL